MIKLRGFNDSQEINFLILFYFFQKLDHNAFVNLEKFLPDTLGVNFEVLKLLHLAIDGHELALSDKAKRFS